MLAFVALAGLLTLAVQPTSGPHSLQIFPPDERPAPIALTPAAPHAIDLNHASQAELETLPGIGSDRALDIIEARHRAPLRSLNDAVQRGLLTRATAAQLTDLVSVYPAAASP